MNFALNIYIARKIIRRPYYFTLDKKVSCNYTTKF